MISRMIAPEVPRKARVEEVRQALERAPMVAILGARQCGKTTLARHLVSEGDRFFDLESSTDRQALAAAPERTLGDLRGWVVLDEIQVMPELLPVLRVLADRKGIPAQFLLLGSAAPDVVRGASETLAGRVAFVYLTGFDVGEIGPEHSNALWVRGSFPRSYLATSDADSYTWRQEFIETFLSRDAARFGITLPPEALRRFWTMLAHLHGGILTVTELARAVSIDAKTAARYVDILTGAFLVRRLPPWFENTGKRLVKSPKVYLRDTGLLHALLGLRNGAEVTSHPRFGASWEGFALEQTIRFQAGERDAYFWATHAGAELDLLLVRGGRRYGFEFKYGDAPSTTKSMRVALAELALETLFVVYPGHRRYELDKQITALPLADLTGLAL